MDTTPSERPDSPDPRVGFWSQTTVVDRLADIIMESKTPPQVKQGAIELRMGCEAFVTGTTGRIALPEKTGEVVIPPGQFALLLIEERIAIPRDAIGFISIKFGLKVRGLVNVSGFHVDPGFDGWLTFSVYNAGPRHITISRGKEAFLLWLASWDKPTPEPDLYSPKNNHGRGGREKLEDENIMHLQGEIASPGALNTKLEELRKEFTTVVSNQRVIITACVALLVAMATWTAGRSNQRVLPAAAPATAFPAAAPTARSAPASVPNPESSSGLPALPFIPDRLPQDILAAVMADGQIVFVLDSHVDRAVAKAKELASESERQDHSLPIVVRFRTSEDLFGALRLDEGTLAGMVALVRGQRCGWFVAGSDSGCQGNDGVGYRTVYYDRQICQPGSRDDECWNDFGAIIGRRTTYVSREACQNNATPTSNDAIRGRSCN